MPTAVGNHDPERLNGIKAVLRSLLISNAKVDVTLPRLNVMFREEEAENIPFREFGYPNLQDFLRSMPDVMNLRYNREHQLCAYHVESEKSAHVSSLVSRQRRPQKKAKLYVGYNRPPPRSGYGNHYNYNSRTTHQSSLMSTSNVLRQILEELRNAPKYFEEHCGIRKWDILQKFKERPGKSSICNIQTLNTKLKELSQALVVDEDFVYFKEDVFSSSRSTPSDPAQKSAKSAYQNLEVRSAPSHPFQLIQVDRPTYRNCQTQMTLPAPTSQSKKALSTDVKPAWKPSGSELVQDRIKFRLQKLIEKYPDGIWASELPSIYWNEYNIDLNYHELGFNSITEFLATVPDILNITDPDDTGRYMILDARIPLNKTETKYQTKTLASHYNFDDYTASDQEPIPSKLSSTVSKKFIPEGMMGLDETVEYIRVGSLAVEDYFEVNISEIFTPSFFWITLRKNKSKIKKLMDELDDFYKRQDLDTCRLPQVLVETGLNVACTYSKMWHRAIIQKVKPDGYVVVLFYDYGTVKTYSPNDLYYLHKKFSALPAQALACGLYNVKAPQAKEWPIQSTNMFVNKVWGVPLIATVCETNEDNNTMMITLTDTNESFDLHLNEWMIECGLAVRGKMENIPSGKYHVVTWGVPLDKLCMYDEDILRKRDKEYEKSLKVKDQEQEGEAEYAAECAGARLDDTKDADSSSNCLANSSFDSSNIATLVRENNYLVKQTNTITQAILSNVPINKLETSSSEMPAPARFNTSENKIDVIGNSNSEDMKRISADLKRNLNAIKNNFSEIANNSCTNSLMTESNQIDFNSNPKSSAVSFSSLSSNFDYMQSTKCSLNELSNHRASNQSLYSHQSISDQSQSVQQNNCQKQSNSNEEYPSFIDGTPTYYSRVNYDDNLSKNNIFIKYSNTSVNQCKANNNATLNDNTLHDKLSYTKASDDGYQTVNFGSSTETCNVSSNTSLVSKAFSAPYFAHELSERCLKKTIHVFHLDSDGWIAVGEFVDCFTNLKLERVMFKLLETFNITVDYKHLTRVENPQLFAQLDQSQIKAPRESNGKIKSDFVLILLPIKTMLHVLVKLDFVDPKIFKEAGILMKQHPKNAGDVLFEKFNNKILYDALNLVIQYRKFTQIHKIQ